MSLFHLTLIDRFVVHYFLCDIYTFSLRSINARVYNVVGGFLLQPNNHSVDNLSKSAA